MAWLVPILAVAAALLVAVLQPGPSEGEHRGSTFRAGSSLAAFELGDDGRLAPYSGAPLDAEAVLGFKVRADGHRSVVVLSVDGEGTVSVFWPEQGDVGEPLTGSGLVALPGTVVLDAAPGPEVFMAVYDMPVAQARDLARRTWQAGGHGALAELARTRAHVDAVAVERAR